MSIEELGRIADATRDWIYSDWNYYLHLKQYGVFDLPGGSKGGPNFHLLKIGRLVEECYGPKPENWKEEL